MNETVARVQEEYREFRELSSYNIFDLESKLVQLAESGAIWMVQGIKDLTEAEAILIDHYLSEKRELQIYDFV